MSNSFLSWLSKVPQFVPLILVVVSLIVSILVYYVKIEKQFGKIDEIRKDLDSVCKDIKSLCKQDIVFADKWNKFIDSDGKIERDLRIKGESIHVPLSLSDVLDTLDTPRDWFLKKLSCT